MTAALTFDGVPPAILAGAGDVDLRRPLEAGEEVQVEERPLRGAVADRALVERVAALVHDEAVGRPPEPSPVRHGGGRARRLAPGTSAWVGSKARTFVVGRHPPPGFGR